ncbi:MAG: NUDIX hydrolase [Victivallaceae bacterium]|nr:NUDIX hydrolase [Victivallaceae bacterium]
MKKKPRILAKKVIAKGKWLSINELDWQDSEARIRTWETAERVDSRGAVMIIPLIEQSDELILVKQFRPPAGRPVIEFPAGLIDPGETAADTADRELYEETGYHGRITEISEPVYSSPGMSGETLIIVKMNIDGECFFAGPPESCQEDGEDIEPLLVKRAELKNFLKTRAEAGWGVDTKLLIYSYAL